ncbi:pigment biosynthesis protein Ayg1 [Delphinella strobiligena]|nr:pigment biosynthesis protein Ayg1 [Delphinella strobiligena]
MSAPTTHKWVLGHHFDSVHPHLESMHALWNKKWKFPCTRSLYPFHDGRYEDLEPIFESLISKNIHSGYTDEYTREFVPTAERLVAEADKIALSTPKEASDLYLRACTVYRIARFPYINSPYKTQVYEAQKTAYLKAASLWECPMNDIVILNTAGTSADGHSIPLYVRLPKNASKAHPCGAVLLLCGLDGHRPDNTTRSDEFLTRGWASVIADIPGTADCPADRKDPKSADRLWTSVLDWMANEGTFDMKRVLVWGLSAGGYNAIRIAHTHAERLAGCVGQGAGTHHFFSREWLEKAQVHEYPWNALPALTEKFGYKDHDDFMDNAQKTWSLVETGIVNMKSCRLLLINGTHDGLMPIEDSILMSEYGLPKESRFITGRLHMGYPEANAYVYPWMESVVSVHA